jgi:hypothetical protein
MATRLACTIIKRDGSACARPATWALEYTHGPASEFACLRHANGISRARATGTGWKATGALLVPLEADGSYDATGWAGRKELHHLARLAGGSRNPGTEA